MSELEVLIAEIEAYAKSLNFNGGTDWCMDCEHPVCISNKKAIKRNLIDYFVSLAPEKKDVELHGHSASLTGREWNEAIDLYIKAIRGGNVETLVPIARHNNPPKYYKGNLVVEGGDDG